MERAARGIDANVHLGVLRRAALGTPAADPPQDRLALAPQGRHGRLVGRFGADAGLGLDQVPELEELDIVVGGLAVVQRAGNAGVGG